MEYGILVICSKENYILQIQLFDFNKLVKFSFLGYNNFVPSLINNDDINNLKKKSIRITRDQFYNILYDFDFVNSNDFFKRHNLEELLI
jgi:hypothetical protein